MSCRALRKCEGERDAAKAANGDLQRQQRTGELYRKKVGTGQRISSAMLASFLGTATVACPSE